MLLGSLFALLSAATFAMNGAAIRRGVLTGTVVQAMAITVPVGLPLFLLAALATGHLTAAADLPTDDVLLLAAAGVLHFVWGRYCNFRAIKAIGGNASVLLQQMDFPLKVTLAVIFLDESLTPLKLFGMGLIMLGSMVGMRRPQLVTEMSSPENERLRTDRTPRPSAFKPKYAEGYTFALLSITGYGVSPVFIRMALENSSIGTSLAGGLVSYAAATLLIMLTLARPSQLRNLLAVDRTSAKWFSFSALCVGFSQMFQYMALAIAPLTVVAPIQRSAVLFRIVLNWYMNRQHEVFGAHLVVGILISVLGGCILSLNTQFLVSYIPLPDSFVSVLQQTWP